MTLGNAKARCMRLWAHKWIIHTKVENRLPLKAKALKSNSRHNDSERLTMPSRYKMTGPSKRQRQQTREAWTLMGVVIGSFVAGLGLAQFLMGL